MPRGGKRPGAGRKPKLRPFADRAAPTLAVDSPPSDAEKRNVVIFVADGMTHEQIALAQKTDIDTLRLRFAHELANGAAIARAQNLTRLREAADAGNVAAVKKLDEILVGAERSPQKAPPLGKKEARALAAQQPIDPDSPWYDLLTPGQYPGKPIQ